MSLRPTFMNTVYARYKNIPLPTLHNLKHLPPNTYVHSPTQHTYPPPTHPQKSLTHTHEITLYTNAMPNITPNTQFRYVCSYKQG